VEEHGAGRDRQRIREQGRDTGGGERAATLEAELERDERKPVAGENRGHESDCSAAADHRLRPHVATGVEDAGGDSEPCPRGHHARGEPGHRQRDAYPDGNGNRGAAASGRRTAGQRGPEQSKTGDCDADPSPFPPRKCRCSRPLDQ
jgi:hypothetical protein